MYKHVEIRLALTSSRCVAWRVSHPIGGYAPACTFSAGVASIMTFDVDSYSLVCRLLPSCGYVQLLQICYF